MGARCYWAGAVAFPSPLGRPRMKSACSSKGDDARQKALGLRRIAVFRD